MSESRLNIELFKKIRERIATLPQSYDQSELCAVSDTAPCGTVCCIAGEAIICNAPTVEQGVAELRRLYKGGAGYRVPRKAIKLLGIGDGAIDQKWHPMFDGGGLGWPERFCEMFGRAMDRYEKAKVAVAYLDHIIETGKVLE